MANAFVNGNVYVGWVTKKDISCEGETSSASQGSFWSVVLFIIH
jgi:hypothetical protein